MLPSAFYNSSFVYPLVRLHIVVTNFKFKTDKFTIYTSYDVGSALCGTPRTIYVDVVNSLGFQILNTSLLEFTFPHPNNASKSTGFPLDSVFLLESVALLFVSNPEAGDLSASRMNVTVLEGSRLLGTLSCSTTAFM